MRKLRFWPEWTIEEKIGQGSYGVVYKIRKHRDEIDGTDIYSALKVLRIPADESEIRNLRTQGMNDTSIRRILKEDVEALENEIRVMISLVSASAIVAIEDYHIEERQDKIAWEVYIRMELLESLPAYLERERVFTEAEALKMGCDLCDALSACEAQNIIHRDIKPANIFRNKFGQYKLGDFGVAKQMEGTRSAATRIGTPSYEAPEIFFNQKYDHTVDIYGLGMVLYAYLNKGRKPFYPPYPEELTRSKMQKALEKRMNGEAVPPVPGMDNDLYTIIEKACAFQPSRRYQSASDMKSDLEKYRYQENKKPVCTESNTESQGNDLPEEKKSIRVKSKKRSGVILMAAGIAALVMIGTTGVMSRQRLSGRNRNIVGKTLFFGTYEQDNDLSNGQEDIEWQILAEEDNKALIISRYELDGRAYHDEQMDMTWESSMIRAWLNSTFIDTAFSDEEKGLISVMTLENDDNPIYGTDGGKSTEDKVFLLSIEEAETYFNDNQARICGLTKYAESIGIDVFPLNDEEKCWWWLRSPGILEGKAAYVSYGGTISYDGNNVISGSGSVRPALWISLENFDDIVFSES